MKPVVFALSVVAMAITSPMATAQVAYTITDIGLLPNGTSSVGWHVNNAGQVIGFGDAAGNTRGFVWSSSTGIVDLGPASDPSAFVQGRGITDAGLLTGTFSSGGSLHAFRTTISGGLNVPGVDLGVLPGGGSSQALGINASGQVVGFASTATGQQVGFRTAPGGDLSTATVLATGGGETIGINASGQVTGSLVVVSGSSSHVFRTTATGDLSDPAADLGTLPGFSFGIGRAINASGQVTGWSYGNHYRAFRTTATGNLSDPSADLGLLPGYTDSLGYDINSLGVVVGLVRNVNDPRAMIYDATGMHDLNDFITPGSGFILTVAVSISDSGYITGEGSVAGVNHAFLLTPVPEPSSLLLAGAALASSWIIRRRRRAVAYGVGRNVA